LKLQLTPSDCRLLNEMQLLYSKALVSMQMLIKCKQTCSVISFYSVVFYVAHINLKQF